jgi:hypothetical protein
MQAAFDPRYRYAPSPPPRNDHTGIPADGRIPASGEALMVVSGDDIDSLGRNSGISPDWIIEGSTTMRIKNYITPVLAAGAAAVAIAAAPAAMADPAPAQPATIATAAALAPNVVQAAGHGGGGGIHGGGGGFHRGGGGFHGGGWGGDRGGWHGDRGWGSDSWPWGWHR